MNADRPHLPNGANGAAPSASLTAAMSHRPNTAVLDTPSAERRRAARVMAERMRQLVEEQMDHSDAQETLVADLRRDLGEARQRIAEIEAKAAKERLDAQAESARLRQDVATLEAEASRLTRELSQERERAAALDDRLRKVAAIATDKTT